jgi:putative transcriptional regulator
VGVSSRLHELRRQKGWTQADLAQLVGVSRQTINSIETSRFEPSLSLALKLAALFEIPVEAMFSLLDQHG